MNYRSITDLANVVRGNLHKIPHDIDLVVGIPRSGLLAANLIALNLNLKFTDLDGYMADMPLRQGSCRQSRHPSLMRPSDAKHVLLVDDSILSGRSLSEAMALTQSAGHAGRITTCAVYAAQNAITLVDVHLEMVAPPRAFEWNLMHRSLLMQCCVDIDGVLCVDPLPEQNDDGHSYECFLQDAYHLVIPSYPIGHLVTSRLEKYRTATEAWLARKGIEYGTLHMLGLPDGETRRRLGVHASFKAKIYREARDALLFIESDRGQAIDIARLSGKQALSFSTQELFEPTSNLGLLMAGSRDNAHRFTRGLLHRVRRILHP